MGELVECNWSKLKNNYQNFNFVILLLNYNTYPKNNQKAIIFIICAPVLKYQFKHHLPTHKGWIVDYCTFNILMYNIKILMKNGGLARYVLSCKRTWYCFVIWDNKFSLETECVLS